MSKRKLSSPEDFDPEILPPHRTPDQIDEDGLVIELPLDPEEEMEREEEDKRDLDLMNDYFSDGKENNDG